MSLTVDAQPSSAAYFRLEITWDGIIIGEYERSLEKNIARKTTEIHCAAHYLVELYGRRGRFVVRWDSATRTKVVRDELGNVIGAIDRECWR